jgi:hypothetical protein
MEKEIDEIKRIQQRVLTSIKARDSAHKNGNQSAQAYHQERIHKFTDEMVRAIISHTCPEAVGTSTNQNQPQ